MNKNIIHWIFPVYYILKCDMRYNRCQLVIRNVVGVTLYNTEILSIIQ